MYAYICICICNKKKSNQLLRIVFDGNPNIRRIPQIIHFNESSHHKSSILGTPMKPPHTLWKINYGKWPSRNS